MEFKSTNGIIVFVKKWHEKDLSIFYFNKEETILNVKKIISQTNNFYPFEKLLLLTENFLPLSDDKKHLDDYKIENESIIKVIYQGVIKSISTFQIYVKTLTGKVINLDVKPEYTIEYIGYLIYKSEGISLNQQRICYATKQLEFTKTIGEYNIKKESTLHLILRIRGG